MEEGRKVRIDWKVLCGMNLAGYLQIKVFPTYVRGREVLRLEKKEKRV